MAANGKVDDQQVDEMVRLYMEEHRPMSIIAIQFHVADGTVRWHLLKRGVRLRPPQSRFSSTWQ